MRALWLRVRALFDRSGMDGEMDEELQFHLDREVERGIARGLAPEEARRVAQLEMGGLDRTRQAVHDARGIGALERLLQDLRFSVRGLARNKAFTATAVTALALGIGANTAVFSAVDAVLLKALPFADPDRLVIVQEARTGEGYGLSYPNFRDLQARAASFESMGVYTSSEATLTSPSAPPERVTAGVVSAGVFPLLGVRPQIGRVFLQTEDAFAEGRVVVLADALWRRRFAADPAVVGRTVTLDGGAFTVVGVMPAGFQFPVQNEAIGLWTTVAVDADPARYDGTIPTSRGYPRYDGAVARLRPGTALAAGRAEVDAIGGSLRAQHRPTSSDWRLVTTPALERLVGATRPAMGALLAAVALVLLIACANVANLLLARAAARQGELAVRSALGASRPRLVRQLLTESVLLALAGGACGLGLAWAGVGVLAALVPAEVPRVAGIAVDWRVALFTLAVSVAAGVVFGLAPALGASRVDLAGALKQAGRTGDAAATGRLRRTLVVAEVALALVLLVAAGVTVRSYARLSGVDPGFAPDRLFSARVALPESDYPQGSARVTAFYDALVLRVRALPGVGAACVVQALPLGGNDNNTSVEVEGAPRAAGERTATGLRFVGLDYFRTMAIERTRGRDFAATDDGRARAVAIVNETFARRYLAGADPVGRRIALGFGGEGPKEIVGVVRDVRHASLAEPPGPEAYVPVAQFPLNALAVVVRSDLDASAVLPMLEEAVHGLDPNLPLSDAAPVADVLSRSVAAQRFAAWLVGLFAAVALVLAGVGVYGVVSYGVAQRTREIGIRAALGARAGRVLAMVVAQGMAPVAVGLALGSAGALVLGRLLGGLVYEGGSGTAPVCAVAAVLLGAIALAACAVPARRATRVDPVTALRGE
ncbi:MAG: ABC transporter permease [Vicinamibacteria bacterium]